jgi:hypothetical protein
MLSHLCDVLTEKHALGDEKCISIFTSKTWEEENKE